MDLAPCSGCRRHVRVESTRCPFCDTTLDLVASRVDLVGRISRAAVFSASLAGCMSPATKGPDTVHHEQTQETQETHETTPPPDDTQFAKPPDGAGSGSSVATTTGSVEGTVTNSASGAGLAGVQVTVHELQLRKVVAQVWTTGGGRYRVPDLAPGSYQIVVQPPGDGHPRHGQPPPVARGITVVAGAPVRVDIDVNVPPPYVDHGPCCKPYGAPPARRRIV